MKKSFPQLSKTIKGSLTENSKSVLGKNIAIAFLGSSLLTPIGVNAATCTGRCDDFITYTYGTHSNQCLTSNYASTVYSNHSDANVYYCGILNSLTGTHLSFNLNGHVSSSPLLNSTFALGRSYAPLTHSSHCSTSCCC